MRPCVPAPKAENFLTKFLDLGKDANLGMAEVEDARKKLSGMLSIQ